MTFDCFTLFNELDLLELRLSILNPYVDWFILTESEETFSGLSKPLYYQENKERFKQWEHKIVHNVVGKFKGDPYERAAYQKNDALGFIHDPQDLVYFGDLDEIWIPQEKVEGIIKLRQYNYTYYLNQRSSEDWYGTIFGKRKYLEGGLTNLRISGHRIPEYAGWHFTNMGGIDQIIKKVGAYDHAHEINQEWFKQIIPEQIKNNHDYLQRKFDYYGKPFEFWLEEKNWPDYLKWNKEKFIHLCK